MSDTTLESKWWLKRPEPGKIFARDVTNEMWEEEKRNPSPDVRHHLRYFSTRFFAWAGSPTEQVEPSVLLDLITEDEMSSNPSRREAAAIIRRVIEETADPKLKERRILMEMKRDAFGRPMKDGKLVNPEGE